VVLLLLGLGPVFTANTEPAVRLAVTSTNAVADTTAKIANFLVYIASWGNAVIFYMKCV
jgi:hypothetical protein